MSDIFVSYASEDLDRIKPLLRALEETGWSVFWDRTIPVGGTWRQVIGTEIDTCRCMVAVWSKRSVDSDWVHEEADEGKRRGVLAPVLIDHIQPPIGFRSIQAARLADWDGRAPSPEFDRLLADLSNILGTPPAKVKEEQQRQAEPEAPIFKSKAEPPDNSHLTKAKRFSILGGITFVLISLIVIFSVNQRGHVPGAGLKANSSSSSGRQLLAGEVFRDRLKDNSMGPEMVVIPAGTFRMGDIQRIGEKDELPVHEVRINNAFAMGRHEVTFEEYDQFAHATGRELPDDKGWGRDRRPVINVSWRNAEVYVKWLSGKTGKRYRLPSEAEWEYAARANEDTTYWWGNELDSIMANCDGCDARWGGKRTAPVASFPENPFSLFDTAGNVREWLQDCWHESYMDAPRNGLAWLAESRGDCGQRVLRSGSWSNGPGDVRSSYRDRESPGYRKDDIGFRLARDLDR